MLALNALSGAAYQNVGFKLFWGGLVVHGWLFILPLWGMAVYPDPGFSPGWTNVWLIGTTALFLFGWGISRGANLQKYTFKRWPDRKFLVDLLRVHRLAVSPSVNVLTRRSAPRSTAPLSGRSIRHG